MQILTLTYLALDMIRQSYTFRFGPSYDLNLVLTISSHSFYFALLWSSAPTPALAGLRWLYSQLI